MPRTRIIDVTDGATFGLLPPCADPAFDHRTCDYWEDADRGSKAHRGAWLAAAPAASGSSTSRQGRPAANPFAPASAARENPFAPARPSANPFAPPDRRPPPNPFALDLDGAAAIENPFAPPAPAGRTRQVEGPRKVGLLTRGLAVFGSYAKVLLVEDDGEDRPAAYAQFGPLSAYPRALRLRELYPRLPQAPLPAVITCIATTAAARGDGLALQLVEAVCDDLAARGFAAIEAYPEVRARPDATSAASPAFWERAGFQVVAQDERFPVVRRDL